MPLLLGNDDPSLSLVVPSMYDLADRLSECAGFQRLNDNLPAIDSREKIHVMEQLDPFDIKGMADEEMRAFTVEDLERILVHANIGLKDAAPQTAAESLEVASFCPEEGWTLEIAIRRQARNLETTTHGDDAVLIDFTDCVCSIVHDLNGVGHKKPPITRRARLETAPKWNDEITESGQGRFMWCFIAVDLGDREGN